MSHSRKTICWVVALTGSFLAVLVNPFRAHGQTGITIEKIAKIWRDRQERLKSVQLTWTERETVPKGAVSSFLLSALGADDATRRMKDMGIEPGEVIPPIDTTFDVAVSLSLDGEKVRHVRDDQQWSAKAKSFVAQPETTVFDGATGKTFRPVAATWMSWPSGIVKARNPIGSSLYLSPVMMSFRPFHTEMRLFDVESLVLTGRRAMVDGNWCLEALQRMQTYEQRVWLDPSRDFVMVRFLSTQKERLTRKIDVRYRQHSPSLWLPDSWEIVMFHPDGKLERSMRGTLASCEINLPLEAQEFEIEFPAGTRVVDLSDPKHETDYIVREGGAKRMILPGEIGATYEQIINSRPGEALGKGKSSLLSLGFLGAAAVAIVATVCLLWRRGVFRKRPT
jgi:hypothetical protein